ncbi:nitrogen-fixing NifU domain protein [Fibrella aestuarina BUZ 2]|uniref:Nitrogen-fixing NifU domain protein n=1 Tax=Fibrella aestuarina BUZ 2 TaxID=1166018 RepID=I0KGD5_9BACT|nr:NifU family protein [Fibrella aestuarina]CCH03188.1 nitrogen-fixing NifU domain protein [Fibrella aestuarina BUZ 2]
MHAALRPPVSIYTEQSPNPNSMKFVLNRELVPDGLSFDYAEPSEALKEGKNSPLAVALFGVDGVRRVFIAGNFITLTKDEDVDWGEILFEVKVFLKDYFEADKPVFVQRTMELNSTRLEADSETVQQIKAALDQYVRPAVESDGGAINFHAFDEATGTVKVLLQGSCSGCPSSTLTLKAGIENLLTRLVPAVKTVEAEGV